MYLKIYQGKEFYLIILIFIEGNAFLFNLTAIDLCHDIT